MAPVNRHPQFPTPPRATFGRRLPPGVKPGPAAAPSLGGQAAPTAAPFVAHYGWRLGLVGFALLSMSSKFIHMSLTAPAGGSFAEIEGHQSDKSRMFLIAAALAAVIGAAWLIVVLFRVPALRIDARGVRGFTLMGTCEFAWADVDRLQVKWDATYKQVLTIHAVYGSKTGGWGIFTPTSIPVMTASLDKKLDAILAAIKVHRPDIAIERNALADNMAKLATKAPKFFSHH